MKDNLRFALITPSYAPDFQRCRLLVESVERCLVGDIKQYIFVDHRDVALFKPLTSPKVQVIDIDALLPSWVFRRPGVETEWISLRTLPIDNWIFQQLIKVSACDAIDEDVLVFCDSDNAFIRAFDLKSCFMQESAMALFKYSFQNKDVDEWIESAKKTFGIENKKIHPATYVSPLVAWHKPNVLKMRKYIEEINQASWFQVLCQCGNMSEYMLYGIFVEHILGLKQANHFTFDTQFIKPSWSIPLETEAQARNFFDRKNLHRCHIGVNIHSKDNVPMSLYADKVRKFWS